MMIGRMGPPGAAGAAAPRGILTVCLAVLWLLPTAVLAGSPSVDFPEAVSRAMKNNPFLAAAGEEWTSAKKEAEAARGSYLPSLTFEERFVRTAIPAEVFAIKINQERLLLSDFASVDNFNKPPPTNEYLSTFTVEQALFAPKAYLGYRMAGREAVAMGLELRRKREEVAHQVLSAYLGVLTAKEFVRVAIQGREDALEHH